MNNGEVGYRSVFHCARCGQDHESVEFKQFQQPVEDADGTVWGYWGTCPVTGDPILMKENVNKAST